MILQGENLKPNQRNIIDDDPLQASVELDQLPKENVTQQRKRFKVRPRERSRHKFNSTLCGCLVKVEHTTTKNAPPLGGHCQLLPSSAIQSMECLNTSRRVVIHDSSYDHLDPSDKAISSSITNASHSTVNLPSCALITDALLSQAKHHGITKQDNAGEMYRSRRSHSKWRSFGFPKRKQKSKNKESVEKPETLDICDGLGDMKISNEAQPVLEVNESLVFSPLSSQVVPELQHTDYVSYITCSYLCTVV